MTSKIQVIDDKKIVESNCVEIISLQSSYHTLIDMIATEQMKLEQVQYAALCYKYDDMKEAQSNSELLAKKLRKSIAYLKRRSKRIIDKIERINNVNNALLKMIK